MISGRIVKGIAGAYDVYVPGEGIFSCHARGIFRKHGASPVPGDFVTVSNEDYDKRTGYLNEILPRENELIRPRAANISKAVVVFAAAGPAINFLVLDTMLVYLYNRKIETVVCINKTDIAPAGLLEEVYARYIPAGYNVFAVSAKLGNGVDTVREIVEHGTMIFTGPSGAGKSSLLNAMFPEFSRKTGDLSRKIARGKNTTRECELLEVAENTFVADSPGFTSFDAIDFDKDGLQNCFPEFMPFLGNCYYGDCLHDSEHDCGVKEHVGKEIHAGRYENYLTLLRNNSK